LIYLGDETIPSFEQAWAAVPDRAEGHRIPRRCADPRWLRYDQAGRLATHLERLFAVVGRDRCMVHLFDDLAADPAASYRQLMEFVGVPPQSRTDFSICRQARKSAFAGSSARSSGRRSRSGNILPVSSSGSGFATSTTATAARLREQFSPSERGFWNGTRVTAPPEPLSPALQAQIRREFEGEVDRLGQLLGVIWVIGCSAVRNASRANGE
jgi:hypothetical protein